MQKHDHEDHGKHKGHEPVITPDEGDELPPVSTQSDSGNHVPTPPPPPEK